MGNFGLDIPWTLIEPEDPSGSDMVDVMVLPTLKPTML